MEQKTNTPPEEFGEPAPLSPQESRNAAWVLVVLFLLSVGLTVWQYYTITAWEATGGRIRMNSAMYLLYKLGGKWAALGILIFAAALFLTMAIYLFSDARKAP